MVNLLLFRIPSFSLRLVIISAATSTPPHARAESEYVAATYLMRHDYFWRRSEEALACGAPTIFANPFSVVLPRGFLATIKHGAFSANALPSVFPMLRNSAADKRREWSDRARQFA
jgi:hypothetical protein